MTRPQMVRRTHPRRPLRWTALLGLAAAFFATAPVVAQTATPLPASTDAAPAASALETWPQWRGPERTGSVTDDAAPWPSDLKGLELAWRAESLGPSYSGPIVGPKRIYTTETRDEKFEVVTAYDRVSGEKVWEKQWPGAMKVPFFAARNGSWIRATPAFDGDTLYVGGIMEVVVALDAATGAERWRLDFPDRFDAKNPPFGFVCSPLVDGDFLYVEAAGSLFKLKKASGEVVWRTDAVGGDMTSEGTFSSPVIADIAGKRQILVQTRQELRGVDPENGAVLWSHHVPSFRGMNILTPTVWGDSVFTSTYRNASYLFDVAAADGGFTAAEKWNNEAQAYMSSPVLIDDVAYSHLGNGRLTAIRLADGERLWTTKPMGSYWSMAHRDDRILALNEQGEMLLIHASPDAFNLIDRKEVAKSETWAHLAVAGDLVIVRDLDALSAWRWKEAAAEPATETTADVR
ncbi:MAG: PQQ-binding-like beta-propeller repeat protein [Acidobacteriota bacterium]